MNWKCRTKDKDKRTQISGYIVFSGEFRKIVQQENPECNFGEISRLVGAKVQYWLLSWSCDVVVIVMCCHNVQDVFTTIAGMKHGFIYFVCFFAGSNTTD